MDGLSGDKKYVEQKSNQRIVLCFPLGEGVEIEELLQTGDKISFCVKKDDLARINDAMFLDMLTLKKEDTTLYTLADYNKYLRIQENKMGMIGVAGVCLPFGAALYFIHPKKVRR